MILDLFICLSSLIIDLSVPQGDEYTVVEGKFITVDGQKVSSPILTSFEFLLRLKHC